MKRIKPSHTETFSLLGDLKEKKIKNKDTIIVITGDAEVIGQNKNVNNLFINKKTNYYYIFLK